MFLFSEHGVEEPQGVHGGGGEKESGGCRLSPRQEENPSWWYVLKCAIFFEAFFLTSLKTLNAYIST